MHSEQKDWQPTKLLGWLGKNQSILYKKNIIIMQSLNFTFITVMSALVHDFDPLFSHIRTKIH